MNTMADQPTSLSSDTSSTQSYTEQRRKELMEEVLPEEDFWTEDDRVGERETLEFAYSGWRRYCHCKQLAPRYTCMRIGPNAGRKYYGCQNWIYRREIGSHFCNFFAWNDGRFPEDAQEFVKYLMCRQEELKREFRRKELNNFNKEIWSAMQGISSKLDRHSFGQKVATMAAVGVLTLLLVVIAVYFK